MSEDISMGQTWREKARNIVQTAIILVLGFWLLLVYTVGAQHIKQETVHAELITIIQNDGDLQAIKHYHSKLPSLPRKAGRYSQPPRPGAYISGTPLSVLLNNIRTNFFLLDQQERQKLSKDFLTRLDMLIAEHNATNPFDKLDPGQKQYFEDARTLAGTEYPKFESQMNKIAEELHVKNRLVSEYLADSTRSLYLSWTALALTLFIALIQFARWLLFRHEKIVLEKETGQYHLMKRDNRGVYQSIKSTEEQDESPTQK